MDRQALPVTRFYPLGFDPPPTLHKIQTTMKINQSRNRFSDLTPPVAQFTEQDECEIRTTDFRLSFTSDGGGYSFDCLSDGTVIGSRLNDRSRESLEYTLSREWDTIDVVTHTVRDMLCMCGSGKASDRQYDARGIFLTSTCAKCHKDKMRGYRSEVLTNSNYECDERIEDDY